MLDRRQFLVTLGLVAAAPKAVSEVLATPMPPAEVATEVRPDTPGYEVRIANGCMSLESVHKLGSVAWYREQYSKVLGIGPEHVAWLRKRGKDPILVTNERSTLVPNGYTLEFTRRMGYKG